MPVEDLEWDTVEDTADLVMVNLTVHLVAMVLIVLENTAHSTTDSTVLKGTVYLAMDLIDLGDTVVLSTDLMDSKDTVHSVMDLADIVHLAIKVYHPEQLSWILLLEDK